MPGGRRIPRPVRSSMSPSLIHSASDGCKYSPLGTVPTLSGLELPAAPKHFPFPNTPMDNNVIFELLMFLYTLVAAGLQFLQLYRTVWWLPHSYNKHSMNFYLIDRNLVLFIIVVLSRRLVYMLGINLLHYTVHKKFVQLSCVVFKFTLFGGIMILLALLAYFIIQNHSTMNIFYLCYPVCVYLILFGFTINPFFELNYHPDFVAPLHACSSVPNDIRNEVETLKTSFNGRMKQILFSSVLNAYYAGFVPCCFAQSFLYYDINWATQHVLFLWLGCFSSYAIHALPLRYCDTLHRSALHLGYWDKVETRHIPGAHTWRQDLLWPVGAVVRHGRDVYRGLGETNAAEPGNSAYARFFTVFWNPSVILAGLLAIHAAMVLFQLTLFLRSYYYWYNVISVTLLLFFNYYTLFKIGRDYLISHKIYKAEQALHDKMSDN